MKDDLVDQCVRALEEADSAVSSYEDLANAVLAIALPAILEEAAYTGDAAAREAVEAGLCTLLPERVSSAILSLAHTTGQEGGR